MDYAIEILTDLFNCFCENNDIDKTNVDYITFLIVLYMWIQKLLNSSTANKLSNKTSFNFINLFNKTEDYFYKNDRFPKQQQQEVEEDELVEGNLIQTNENNEYIKKIEHENKNLNDYVDTLKVQIENIDDLNIQLHNELNLKCKDNER
jgi:hypothetical protein